MKLDIEPFYQEGWYGLDVAGQSVLHGNWEYANIAVWCRQTYGNPNMRENTKVDRVRWRDQLYDGILYFRDEVDRSMFILKWS